MNPETKTQHTEEMHQHVERHSYRTQTLQLVENNDGYQRRKMSAWQRTHFKLKKANKQETSELVALRSHLEFFLNERDF